MSSRFALHTTAMAVTPSQSADIPTKKDSRMLLAQKHNYLSKYKKSLLPQVNTKIFTSHRFYLRHRPRQNLEMGVA